MPSFDNIKDLKFVITLGTASFDESGDNQITLKGFRSVVEVQKAGGVQMGTLHAQIYGLATSDMNAMTTLQWKQKLWKPNTVVVYAVDGTTETMVFAGNVVNAFANYTGMPDACFQIMAQSAFYASLAAVPPTSVSGSVAVVTLMEQIATEANLYFDDNGVVAYVIDPYLPYSPLDKAKALQQMVGFDMYIDDMVLSISPAGTALGDTIPQLSATSGLYGYPTFDGMGVTFQCLFNPAIKFGAKINLSVPEIPIANGDWVVQSISHRLETYKPGGAWFSTVRATLGNLTVTK